MRTLHIHSGNLYGGVESVLRTMARYRAALPKCELAFALCFEGRIAEELRAEGCEVHILGPVRASNPFSVHRARKRIAELTSGGVAGLSVMHSPWSLAVLGPAVAGPLIYFQHDLLTGRHWTEKLARRRRPDAIVVNSWFAARTTGNVFPRATPIVVHPPVDLRRTHESGVGQTAMRRHFCTPADKLVILQAGRYEPWKGHQLLLSALGRLRASPEWFLWIAGEPQRPSEEGLKADLVRQARELGLAERIAFIGHTTDMDSVMRSVDIYCQPNTAPEPFGLTFVEALHAGVPLVTTSLGGAKEILEPSWGLLTEANAGSLATALHQLLEQRELRLRLAQAGPARARQLCDPTQQMERFYAALRPALAHEAAA